MGACKRCGKIEENLLELFHKPCLCLECGMAWAKYFQKKFDNGEIKGEKDGRWHLKKFIGNLWSVS